METLFVALRVALSLGAVLALLWVVQRRFARGGVAQKARARAANLLVVGRQNVGAKASVVVLEHDGRRFLLGVSEHGVSVLHSAAIPRQPQEPQEPRQPRQPQEQEDPPAVAQPDDDFARLLADASTAVGAGDAREGAPAAGRRGGALAGSIVSPSTWKQAAVFVRNGR